MDGSEADVVYAVRRARAGETAFKRGTAKLFYRLLSKLAEIEIPLDTGDFRLMSRRALDALLACPSRRASSAAWSPGSASGRCRSSTTGPSAMPARPIIRSRKMMRLALDAVTGFSTAPLRFASHVGLWLVAASILLLVYIAIGFFTGTAIQGWTSLMLVVVVLGAVQMFVLGMIGEYLGRLYIEAEAPAALHRLGDRRPCRRQPPASAMSLTPPVRARRAPAPTRSPPAKRRAATATGRSRALEPENPLEQSVDRPRRQRVVAVLLAGQPARPAAPPRRAGRAGC